MRSKTDKTAFGRWAVVVGGILALVMLHTVVTGCSRAEDAEVAEAPRAEAEHRAAPQEHVPAPEIAPGAQTVEEAYPRLATSGLASARLADLAEDALVQAEGLRLTEADVEHAIGHAPEDVRDQFQRNRFFVLEQLATDMLLDLDAKATLDDVPDDEQAMIQAYLTKVLSSVDVSDGQVEAFYEENREALGETTFEEVEEAIRQHLLLEAQEQVLTGHVRSLGARLPVAVSASWAEREAEAARDNPVDRARASGKPSFVNFGAEDSPICEEMAPMRESTREKHEGKLNVVYVQVGDEQVLALRYGIQSIPTLFFYDAGGTEVSRHTGVLAEEEIMEELARIGVQ